MSRFLRSLPAQLLLVTILPFTLVLAAVAFGSVAMHQQAMRQMVSERDMRTVMATSLMLQRLLERTDGFHHATHGVILPAMSEPRRGLRRRSGWQSLDRAGGIPRAR